VKNRCRERARAKRDGGEEGEPREEGGHAGKEGSEIKLTISYHHEATVQLPKRANQGPSSFEALPH
jgi:hypothetical protein